MWPRPLVGDGEGPLAPQVPGQAPPPRPSLERTHLYSPQTRAGEVRGPHSPEGEEDLLPRAVPETPPPWAGRYPVFWLRGNGGQRVTCVRSRVRARGALTRPPPWSARALSRRLAGLLGRAAVRTFGARRLPAPRPCDRLGEDGEWKGARGVG